MGKKENKTIEWEQIFLMARMANDIYDTHILLDNLKRNYDHIYVNEQVSTPFAFVSDSEKNNVYIIFRGSDNINNWLTNFHLKMSDTTLFDGANVKVHKGFLLAYKKIREQLFIYLNSLKKNNDCFNNKKYNLFIIGHSLGAVFAQLLCADNRFNIDDFLNVYCVTFGSPRVGNFKFSRHLNNKMFKGDKIYRFQCSNDIVTRLPLFFGYKHAGKPYYFDRNGRLYRKINLIKLIFNQIIDRTLGCHLLAGLRDHNMQQYVCVICKQIV